MDYIYGKFLGNSSISYNGTELSFSYNKVKALFIYLIVNKCVTRDEVSALLWSHKQEHIAKKNLRNALYLIKRHTNINIFSDLNKANLCFSKDIIIETDLDKFMNSNKFIDIYSGEFLKGFFLKDSETYEAWIIDMRSNISKLYFEKINASIEIEKRSRNFSKVEYYCNLLISQDNLNEGAYRNLLESYYEQGKINDAIKTYNELSSILDRELSITPDAETDIIFNKVLNLINIRKKQAENQFFFGRYEELKFLENNYNNFINQTSISKSIIIKGEMGIGKTKLIENFKGLIDNEVTFLFEVDCYEFDTENVLKPFKNLVLKLYNFAKDSNIVLSKNLLELVNNLLPELNSNNLNRNILKYEVIPELIISLINEISIDKKLVFIFEDIQWMDYVSLSILTNLIFDSPADKAVFYLTCRDDYNLDVDKFVTIINKYEKMHCIRLRRFDYDGVYNFLNKALPSHKLSKATIDKIYSETEGNTFFIVEYINLLKLNKNINIMTSKMKDIIKSRFIGISNEGKKILDIASLFDDEIPIGIFTELLKKDELYIIDLIEELENKSIFEEITKDNGIFFKFTHQKFREFIYMNLSQARKKIMHNLVGKYLEKRQVYIKNDINIYHKLIYHFEKANNYTSTLKYIIKNLNIYLNFSHELFPILDFKDKTNNNLYFNERKTKKYLNKLEVLILKIKNDEIYNDEVITLEIEVLHIKGRYLIRKGDYAEGIELIKNMINIAKKSSNYKYIIEGYKQLIYYCIQTNTTKTMLNFINEGIKIATNFNNDIELGVFLRLSGQYHKMIGQYDVAEDMLNESIKKLSINSSVSDKYSASIAAAYNYIGDIRTLTNQYSDALNYYEKAIEICKDKNVLTSLAIFYVNAGQTSFKINNFSLCEDYLKKALDIYKHYDLIWGRSIAESLMCMLNIKKEDYGNALKFLISADTSSKFLQNPKELSLLYTTKAHVKTQIENNTIMNSTLKNYLNEDLNTYLESASKYLNIINTSAYLKF